jgi:release factor glutamine methyltransferase
VTEPAPSTWRQLLAEATEILASSADARRIVEEAAGFTPAEFIVNLDQSVPARPGAHLSEMVARRATGEPLQYTLGRWGFRTLDLMVDHRVLIPRPETEQVAGLAIDEARQQVLPLIVADLGTGSGAIAISIAAEVPEAQVWATDASAGALDVASANLSGLGGLAATRVRLAQGSWFDALPAALRGRLGVIVSNPPYIADDEALPPDVEEWEPRAALRSGPTGVECLAHIIEQAPGWLRPGGVLVLELAPHQATEASSLATEAGFVSVDVRVDLTGRDRALVARR